MCVSECICRHVHEALVGVLLPSPGVYSVCVPVAPRSIIQYQQVCVLCVCACACVSGGTHFPAGGITVRTSAKDRQKRRRRGRQQKQYGCKLGPQLTNILGRFSEMSEKVVRRSSQFPRAQSDTSKMFLCPTNCPKTQRLVGYNHK